MVVEDEDITGCYPRLYRKLANVNENLYHISLSYFFFLYTSSAASPSYVTERNTFLYGSTLSVSILATGRPIICMYVPHPRLSSAVVVAACRLLVACLSVYRLPFPLLFLPLSSTLVLGTGIDICVAFNVDARSFIIFPYTVLQFQILIP